MVKQNRCVPYETQKGLTMHEASTPSSTLLAILALASRIERNPRFQIRDVFAHPYPFVEVKDTAHGIVVGFSSEDELVTYLRITTRKGA